MIEEEHEDLNEEEYGDAEEVKLRGTPGECLEQLQAAKKFDVPEGSRFVRIGIDEPIDTREKLDDLVGMLNNFERVESIELKVSATELSRLLYGTTWEL